MFLVSGAITACAPDLERRDRVLEDAGVAASADAGAPTDAPALSDASLAQADAAVAIEHEIDAAPEVVGPCVGEPVETWTGTARRDNENGYPDHIGAEVTWTRTGTEGCVDTYVPAGVAQYGYAIPGALCQQWITPDQHEVTAGDGTLTIDRSVDPPKYTAHGATTWQYTWHCEYDDGTTETLERDGGAVWMDAVGVVAGGIDGSVTLEDDTVKCGPEGIPPCTYRWSFAAD
jgi:hypothetical protein